MSVLTRIPGTRVYNEPLPPAGPAFLLFLAFGDLATLPAQIATGDAWEGTNLPGWFVVLPEAPADLAQLAAVLQASDAFSQPEHTSVVWTSYDGKALQPPQRLALRGEALTVGPASLAVGRYGLVLPDGNPVLAQLDGSDLVSLRITYLPREGWPAPNDIGCFVPFTGPARFCIQALGLIGDAGDDVPSGADISIRYFVPIATTGTAMQSIRFPLLETDPGIQLVANATIDPLTNWWTAGASWQQRTSYRISGQMYQLSEAGGVWSIAPVGESRLRTTFRTVTGSPLYLRPLDASFVAQPLAGEPGAFYLTPGGTFALETESAEGGGELLCGLAATERVAFTSGDVMTFVPGSPAHAVQFPVTATATPGSLLDGTAVTAWASITPGGANTPSFHAQPRTSATYGTPAGTTPVPNIAPFYSPAVATFSAGAVAFPIAPYAAVEDPSFDYAGFEEQILAPSRMTAIATSPDFTTPSVRADADAGGVSATTPQGFLVTVSGTDWSDLQFASQTRSDGTVQTLSVATVSADLRAALQSRTLFLVVTSATQFAGFAGLISIADWPFDLTKLGETDAFGFRNVLVFKFCSGTANDLAGNLARWTTPGTFNDDPTKASTWLSTYFETAISLAENNDRYANIATILQDSDWNGILGLRVDVPMASLPDDLRGLAAGIDAVQFAAHHLGVNVTSVQQQADGSFQMPPTSSLFGLINYVDQDTQSSTDRRDAVRAAAGPGDPGYSFRVLTLFAEFENSQIIGFDSQIVLTMTTFFGEPAQRQLDPSAPAIQQNSVELFGSLEHRIAPDGTTVVVYVFQTQDSVRYLLPASQIFNYIEIAKMEFSTLKPQTEGSTHVASQFRMWGLLNFQITGGIDLFSFGDATPPPSTDVTPTGLAYANLIVSMDFDDPGNVVQNLAFLFDPTGVAFDIGATTAVRQPSLFSGLPLSLDTIVTGDAADPPSGAGYLPVLARSLTGVAPLATASGWFGLTFILSLGTPGALADISSFNATLVAAWSPGAGGIPGTPQPQAALLIQLPGTAPGKKELSLQQVLRLSIDQIAIDPQPPVEGYVALKLTFTNVGLKFLGFKFPSGAVIDLALAGGGMSGGAGSGSIGWYGVYAKS